MHGNAHEFSFGNDCEEKPANLSVSKSSAAKGPFASQSKAAVAAHEQSTFKLAQSKSPSAAKKSVESFRLKGEQVEDKSPSVIADDSQSGDFADTGLARKADTLHTICVR